MHHRILVQQKTQLGYRILFSVSYVDHTQCEQQHQLYDQLTEFICLTVIYPSAGTFITQFWWFVGSPRC